MGGGNTEHLTLLKKMGLGTAKPQLMVWQSLDPKFLHPIKLNKSPKNEPKSIFNFLLNGIICSELHVCTVFQSRMISLSFKSIFKMPIVHLYKILKKSRINKLSLYLAVYLAGCN